MVDTLMKNTAPTMTTYQLPEDRTRVELAFPVKRTGVVVSIEFPKDGPDDIQLEAIQQIAESLSNNIEWLACTDDIKRRASQASTIGRLRTYGFVSRCEDTINRVFNIFPMGKDQKLVAFRSLARHRK
jgi:hypothetical protein